LIAVLEKRIGLNVGTMDVFVNAVGGMRITETAADLGVLTCMASSVRNSVVDAGTVILGEVGLSGEVRAISQIDKRLAEAEKMGFKQAIIPKANLKSLDNNMKLQIHGVHRAEEALEIALA
jgi:DNA repair protein RadA/Sms